MVIAKLIMSYSQESASYAWAWHREEILSGQKKEWREVFCPQNALRNVFIHQEG